MSKRALVAGLWLGSLVLAWVVLRDEEPRAPVAAEREIEVSTPSAAREQRLRSRAPRLEPLPPAAAMDEPDDSAFRDARAALERDLADGRWSAEDRDRLNAALPRLTADQASELFALVFPPLNSGAVTSEIDGPPI